MCSFVLCLEQTERSHLNSCVLCPLVNVSCRQGRSPTPPFNYLDDAVIPFTSPKRVLRRSVLEVKEDRE